MNCSNSETNTSCHTLNDTLNITYSVGSLTGIKSEGYFELYEDNRFYKAPFLLVNEVNGMDGAVYEGIVGLPSNKEDDLLKWPISFYLNFGHN